MLKRPLDKRFNEAVKEGRKFTTIRVKPWKVGTPIMLYNWEGKPYRSKHIDVVAVVPIAWWPIDLIHLRNGSMQFKHGMENDKPLYEIEGFENQEEMDQWFRKEVKREYMSCRNLIRFRLL